MIWRLLEKSCPEKVSAWVVAMGWRRMYRFGRQLGGKLGEASYWRLWEMREMGPSQISSWTNRMNGDAIHWRKSRLTGKHKVRFEFMGVK